MLFDNGLAKKTKDILFLKISNDGFDLGAQRRGIDKNDLPLALEVIKAYKNILSVMPDLIGHPEKLKKELDSRLRGNDKWGDVAHLVAKAKIAESGDYNLSGDRYIENVKIQNSKFKMVELGEVCTFEYGKPLKEIDRKGGEYPVYGSNGIVGFHNEYLVKGPFIIVGRKGTAGAVVYSEKSGFPIDTTFYVHLKDQKVDLKFLYLIMTTLDLGKVNIQAGVPGLNRNDAYKVKIPLPPLEVQKEIVEQIEVKQKAIEAAKAVIENLERETLFWPIA